jgi:hypothetical protein
MLSNDTMLVWLRSSTCSLHFDTGYWLVSQYGAMVIPVLEWLI